MEKSTKNELRRGRSCIYLMHAHLVFVTKYRRKIFNSFYLQELHDIFERVCGDFDVVLKEFNGEGDHVHLLVNYPTKVPIAGLVNSLKGVSSRMLKKKYPEVAKNYWRGALWSPSYFAGSCGGAPLSILKEYIQNQTTPS